MTFNQVFGGNCFSVHPCCDPTKKPGHWTVDDDYDDDDDNDDKDDIYEKCV